MQFGLLRLLWLIACCALVAWSFRLPPLFFNGFFEGTVVGTGERVHYETSSSWPGEIAVRIGAGGLVFAMPLILVGLWRRLARRILPVALRATPEDAPE